MKDNNDCIYEDNFVDIHGEVLDKDFDDAGWEPEVEDDSDIDAEELYGL